MNYRRAHVPGGTYFFTVVTRNRAPVFADIAQVERLKAAFSHVRDTRPFRMPALVVLPDHLHTIWTLPEDDTDFSTRWRLIKHYVQRASAEPLWQPRFWEHVIRDEDDFGRHFDYIHGNPVKHGLVNKLCDWPHSTFHRYVNLEVYSPDWCEIDLEMDLD